MRSVILCVGLSLDGYLARTDGSVDFLFMPKDFSMKPFLDSVDTAVMGRKSLDAALQMGGGKLAPSPFQHYVFSRSASPPACPGVEWVRREPAEFVAGLRLQPGKNVWLMGGGELTREFLRADLVDELYLGVVPVLLGDGIPVFGGGFPQRNFTLVENQTFAQGMIALRYIRTRASA